MKSMEVLMSEHREIERGIRILEKICAVMETGRDTDVNDLDGLLVFLTVFADRCHHAKEERVLFPAMQETGIRREGGPIGVMLGEHEAGRAYIQEVVVAIAGLKNELKGAAGKMVKSAQNYTTLLRNHIYKEDNMLYRMALSLISVEADRRMCLEFEKIETEAIGKNRRRQFHQMLEMFEEKYK